MHLPRTTAKHSLNPAISRYDLEPGIDGRTFWGIAPEAELTPQSCSCGGNGDCTCGTNTNPSYVYTFGSLRPAFPSRSIEKEFYQAANEDDKNKPPKDLYFEILSRAENLYIAREMCWILEVGGVDANIVKPATEDELVGFISAIAKRKNVFDLDIILGTLGPTAPLAMCNGVELPIILCNQIYTITTAEFIEAIMATTGAFREQANAMFAQMLELTDNTGETDDDRALNFINLRYMGVYQKTFQLLEDGFSLIRVQAMAARVQGTRKILDVIFTYHKDTTGVWSRWYCRVDITGEFPFLVSRLAVYYVRQ